MAETTLRERPEHLRTLVREARIMAERRAGRTLYHPDDDALVAQWYDCLRMRACRKEIDDAGIMRLQVQLVALLPSHPRNGRACYAMTAALAARIPSGG